MTNLLTLTPQAMAQYFDHALLKPNATKEELEAFCEEGMRLGVKMLAINPAAVALCAKRVQGTGVLVGAAIGFPLGQTTLTTKLFETKEAIANGSGEIDYVINLTELKSGSHAYITQEMQAIVSICQDAGVVSKVIFENCYLSDDEKKTLCDIANQVKPDFIKTSTGFGTSGALIKDVQLMRQYADAGIGIKASGGIKTWSDAAGLIQAGATRIGTSSTAGILEEFRLELLRQ